MHQHFGIHKARPNTGALDFSRLLDAPAGKHGFVKARNGHLYFEGGLRARFIGFNLPTRSNTPDHETAEKVASRFASLGVNVIRLHAADAPIGAEPCSWSSCKDTPLIDYASGTSRAFHKEGLDRFDYFAACLKEKGIYLHIDLHVARAFQEGDQLAYPGAPDAGVKCYGMINERLICLQQEYAKRLLCHVNPYTGLALKDDPAVMTVQVNNEDSVLKESRKDGSAKPYRAELQRAFNRFLLAKYGSRETLKTAWTHGSECALRDDEDPCHNTVDIVEGSFIQPVNDPLSDFAGASSPARYADYMCFGIEANRRFYRRMIDFLRNIGVKVPISTSNLLGGAADVYGHSDADIMENNSYFNHPMLPTPGPNQYIVPGPTEYVSVDPLTMQRNAGALATTLISLASEANVAGKPFLLSEWNEYGLHPFHSTSYLSTVAYACLNDWDGLILYCHHTSEKWDDQPDDEIRNVFDAYNDPALIGQWGFLSAVFLKGLLSPAPHRVDITYTPNDLTTLPDAHAMPKTYLPYITSTRQVFQADDAYRGNADAVVNAGYLNIGDLKSAKHSVYYAWSPYRDAFRKYEDQTRLTDAAKNCKQIGDGVSLSDQSLVFDDIRSLAGDRNYRAFAQYLDAALKRWRVIPENTGLINGKMISETGEITSDPTRCQFAARASGCSCFSGAPGDEIILSDRISIRAKNERVTLTLLPLDDARLDGANSFLLTAIGKTGMDETAMSPVEIWPGIPFHLVSMHGKLFVDTLEGTITVHAQKALLEYLDAYGSVIKTVDRDAQDACIRFALDGRIPSVNLRLTLYQGKR